MARLYVVTPRGLSEVVELGDGPFTLGRGEENRLSYPEDSGLSRQHLVVEETAEGWLVRDLESKNGTLVNGREIHTPQVLQPGDRISASRVTLTYQEPGSASGRVSFLGKMPGRSHTVSLEELLAREAEERPENHRPLGFFVHAGRELARHRPLPELYGVILELCLDALPAERGLLLTFDERGQIEIQASRGDAFRISATVRDTVLREKRSMLVESALEDERIRKSQVIERDRVQSVLAAPLQSDDQVFGLIYLDTLDPARETHFSHRDLDLLTALASVAGLRIELEQGQQRVRQLIAENARNLSRLTASLSHELGTPLGALKSSLDSLWRVAESGRSLSDDERARLESVEADLRAVLDESLRRMQDVIGRIQRFANLDRAERRCIDLGDLLTDVLALLEAGEQGVAMELVPFEAVEMSCHPQALSGALSSIAAYAREAAAEAGADRVGISVSRARDEPDVTVRFAYHGKVLPREEVERLLEPSFEIASGRVAARTWSLFSARQIVKAQGGEILPFSERSGETGFLVNLPAPAD